jgi:hypothetical protein
MLLVSDFNGAPMKTHVTFRSSKFPPYEGEQEEINDGIWGRRLAEYLSQELTRRGVAVGKVVAEDWGCYIPVEDEAGWLGFCCGHQHGDDDEFQCFTDPSTPIVRKWFRKVDRTASLERLIGAVRAILEDDPDIREIEWRESF